MENKYKERAIELKLEYLKKWEDSFDNANGNIDKVYDSWIEDAMCQLAEEVEKEIWSKRFSSNPKDQSLYTKEQVEELLQKQRELCNSNAYAEESSIGYHWEVNEDSILNAKLEID